MTQVDLDREQRPLFSQRFREECEDALIKRYLHKESGEPGPPLSEDERRQALQAMSGQRGLPLELKVEQMRKRFMLGQQKSEEIAEFKSMEEYMDTLFMKY